MLRRFILWDYPRASWQYDVMVGIILAFVFLTPRDWFRDQPRIPHAVNIGSERGSEVVWIEPELLAGVPEGGRVGKLNQALSVRTGKRRTVNRVEPIYDSEGEIKGYMAFLQP